MTQLAEATLAAHTGLLAQPGAIAFLVIFGMGVILVFVFRSMSRHLRKINNEAREESGERVGPERAPDDADSAPGEAESAPGEAESAPEDAGPR